MVNSLTCANGPTNHKTSAGPSSNSGSSLTSGLSQADLNMASLANSGFAATNTANNNGQAGSQNHGQAGQEPAAKTVKLEVLEEFFGSGWDDEDGSGFGSGSATGGPLLAASPPMSSALANTPSPQGLDAAMAFGHGLPTLTPRPGINLGLGTGLGLGSGIGSGLGSSLGSAGQALLMANGNRPLKVEEDNSSGLPDHPDVFASLSPLPSISLSSAASVKTGSPRVSLNGGSISLNGGSLQVVIPPSTSSSSQHADTTTVTSQMTSSSASLSSVINAHQSASAAAAAAGQLMMSSNDSQHSSGSPSPPSLMGDGDGLGGPLLSPSTPTSNKKTVFTAKGKGTHTYVPCLCQPIFCLLNSKSMFLK